MPQKYRSLSGTSGLALALVQPAFGAETAEVLHWWTTEAQSKGVKVFADALPMSAPVTNAAYPSNP